jgi:Flp pilus assembly protein TadG
MVAPPFVLLPFGILSVCLCFFTAFTLENAVWQAARAICTVQVQQSQGDYTAATTNDDRKKLCKKAMCTKAPSFFDCLGKAVVIAQSNVNFGSIVEPKCATRGVMAEAVAAAFDPGNASSVVLLTVCYPWDFGAKLPFIRLGNLKNGALLIQASVTFRTEPYN